jgi:hypothetical protein
MTFNGFLLVVMIAGAVAAAIALSGARRGAGSGDRRGQLEKLRTSGHYWGVKIQPGQCNAIRSFAGRRFSFDEAPELPLQGCTAKRCACSYVGVTERRREDRRTQMDRRSIARIDDAHADRRSLKGRRRHRKERVDPAD